ncbi:MAG: sigma 54-interacting transcriptional regulator [Myxococcota bacterium]
MARILIVESDVEARDRLVAPLEGAGHETAFAGSLARAKSLVDELEPLDAVLIGPSADRTPLLAHIASERPEVPALVIADAKESAPLIEQGVFDVLTETSDATLVTRMAVAARHRRLSQEVHRLRDAVGGIERGDEALVGRSPAMRRVFDLFDRVGDQTRVLLTGEDGTGKGLAARVLHERSRRDGPFVTLDASDRDGSPTLDAALKQAAGGTLYVRFIDALSRDDQSRLQRYLEDLSEGPRDRRDSGARIIASAETGLDRLARTGRFREDLYYLINVVHIRMPPLRQRGHDVVLLAQHFLDASAKEAGRDVLDIGERAAERFLEYDWPGNVQELKTAVTRAVDLARYDQITIEDLPEAIRRGGGRVAVVTRSPAEMPTLETLEKRYVKQVLEATSGNKTRAAKVLGVDRRTLYRKLDRWAAAEGTRSPDTSNGKSHYN